jgi:hypothetical protein
MLWIGLWWYETCLNRIEIMPVWLETQLDRVEIESDYMDRIGERESLVGRARECIWGTEGAPGAWVHIDTHKNSQRSRGDKGRTMFVMLWKQNGNKDLFWWIKRNLGDFSGQDIYIYSTFFFRASTRHCPCRAVLPLKGKIQSLQRRLPIGFDTIIELKHTFDYNCHSHYNGKDLSIHLNKVIVTLFKLKIKYNHINWEYSFSIIVET